MRIGLSGAGQITPFHLRGWQAAGAELVAIADPDIARAEARAREFGIRRCYADLAAMLAAEPLDALDIASPRQVHVQQVLMAAERGIPVLCQKPLAPTLPEAAALLRRLGGRTRLMVHENWRFRPYYRQVQAWLREGRFGRVTGCVVSVHSAGLIRDAAGRYPSLERQPFFREEQRLLVAETLIHHLDVVRWLLGPLRMLGAQLQRDSDAVPGETAAMLLMRSARDVGVLVQGNLACAGLPARAGDRFELFGTEASAVLEGNTLRLLGPQPAEIRYDQAETYQACFTAAIAHFVACLHDGRPFETAPEDNLETLRLVEDAYRLAA